MSKKILLFIAFIVGAYAINAQQNFTFTPEKPKSGEVIKITYEPAGDIANTMGKVEGFVYLYDINGLKAIDLILTKSGKKYTASIPTDTSSNFVQFGFYVGEKYDNNYNEGYVINLYQGDKIRKGSYFSQSGFHQYYCDQSGVDRSKEKAFVAMEKEINLYPEQKKNEAAGWAYYSLLTQMRKNEAPILIQREIEATLNAGLKKEEDYLYLRMLYSSAKQPEQEKLMESEQKIKFPDGKWVIEDKINKFYKEKDPSKKAEVLEKNVLTDKNWKLHEQQLPNLKFSLLNTYAKAKQWDDVKKLGNEISDKSRIASTYNNLAWGMQEKNEDLKMAEEFAKYATEYARTEMEKPLTAKPDHTTQKKWAKTREFTYAMYADTYAMVLYRLGDYQNGFELTKEAAIDIRKGDDPDQNNTYTLLAEKVLPANELKPQLEKFVKEGKSTSVIKDILKKHYVEEKTSEAGFDDYIAALEKEAYLKILEELKKTMINETAPSFSLADLDGNKINSADLKGKVVIVDFWATWCGPCKASFPGMQKIVTKFKDNPNVKFVFIDSWERGEGKEKNAADFIAKNKYTFQVLMDNDNTVINKFNVDGIPTKFIIDKEGKVRFKSVGFDGSDDKLITEISAMIEMASGEKTF